MVGVAGLDAGAVAQAQRRLHGRLGRPRHAHDTHSREGHGDEEHEETLEPCGSVGRSQGSHPFRVRVLGTKGTSGHMSFTWSLF